MQQSMRQPQNVTEWFWCHGLPNPKISHKNHC